MSSNWGEQNTGAVGRNFDGLREFLHEIPLGSVSIPDDGTTLLRILRLPEFDAGEYLLYLKKNDQGNIQALFGEEIVKDQAVEIGLHPMEYIGYDRKKKIGIGVNVKSLVELAFAIRFLQTLWHDSSTATSESAKKKWARFKNIDFLISKSIVTGDERKGGNVEFRLGQFKMEDDIEDYIIERIGR